MQIISTLVYLKQMTRDSIIKERKSTSPKSSPIQPKNPPQLPLPHNTPPIRKLKLADGFFIFPLFFPQKTCYTVIRKKFSKNENIFQKDDTFYKWISSI